MTAVTLGWRDAPYISLIASAREFRVSGETQMTMLQKLMSIVAATAFLLPFGVAMMTQAAQIVA